MKTLDANNLFPITELTRLPMPPTYADVLLLNQELNMCANAVHNPYNAHGFAYLSHTTDAYVTLTGEQPPDWPIYPGADPPETEPVGGNNPTQHMIAETERMHTIHLKTHSAHVIVHNALKKLILQACPHSIFSSLKHATEGLSTVTTKAMITLLWKDYGRITKAEKSENRKRMETPWSAEQPIEDLFEQLDKCQQFSIAANDPITDVHLCEVGYNLVMATGRFAETCREWRHVDDAEATYDRFRDMMRAAHRDNKETTGSNGYHASNAAKDELATLKNEMAQLKATIAAMMAKPMVAVKTEKRTPSYPTAAPNPASLLYCWSHGFVLNSAHTSATCSRRNEGHQELATGTNQMGGNPKTWQRVNKPAN
jgi:hypothetical protein